MSEPRVEDDYEPRQVEAAQRVLIDIGQVLASFLESIVVVGGWVPDLLIESPTEAHVGSVDVDLALDARRLGDGRYAELLALLLDTGRYRQGEKSFQLVTDVDLGDGESPVRVDVDFLAPEDVRLKKSHPKLIEGFRVLQFPACAVAFVNPEERELTGKMTSGAENTVSIRVASLPDFLLMKAHAIGKRDKPKDAYDFCYCFDEVPDAFESVATNWRARGHDPLVVEAVRILSEKFKSTSHYGPRQLAQFHSDATEDDQEMHARRAFETVSKLLGLLSSG